MLLSKIRLQVRLSLLCLLAIGLLLGLAACADNTTPTPTLIVSPGVTSGTNTGGSVSNSKLNIPGVTPVTLDPTLEKTLKDLLSLNSASVPDLGLTIYTSNDAPSVLGENADKTLTSAGYAFHDVRGGNDTALVVRDQAGAGAYTKSGTPDLVLEARDSKALTAINSAPPGVSPDAYQKMLDQVKDKASVLIILSGTNLYQAIVNARNNSPLNPTPTPTK